MATKYDALTATTKEKDMIFRNIPGPQLLIKKTGENTIIVVMVDANTAVDISLAPSIK
jgi:hypothetical protein